MEFLFEYGLFLAKTITFVLAFAAIIAIIAASAMKQTSKKGHLEITDLSEQFAEVEQDVIEHLLTKEQLKEKQKQDKKAAKQKAKTDKKQAKDTETEVSPRLFVDDFKGSMDAKEVNSLREEVSRTQEGEGKGREEVPPNHNFP